MSALATLGVVLYIVIGIALPITAYRENRRLPQPSRAATVGIIIMSLLALLNVVVWFLLIAHVLSLKASVNIGLLDLTLLGYAWTAPNTWWQKMRKGRVSFWVMVVGTLVLLLSLVVIFPGIS
jgi:hypothetical protein